MKPGENLKPDVLIPVQSFSNSTQNSFRLWNKYFMLRLFPDRTLRIDQNRLTDPKDDVFDLKTA